MYYPAVELSSIYGSLSNTQLELALDYTSLSYFVVLFTLLIIIISYCCHSLRSARFDKIAKVTLDKMVNFASAVIAIVWASSVSIYGLELKNQLFGTAPIQLPSFIFLTSVSIALLISVVSFLAKQTEKEKKLLSPPLKSVYSASEEISKLIHLHAMIQIDFSEHEDFSIDELNKLDESIIQSKKLCMKGMLEVLKTWSNDQDVMFSVNLLNIVDSTKLSNKLQNNDYPRQDFDQDSFSVKSIEASPFFLFKDHWISSLDRCDLILINEQSLTTSIGGHSSSTPHEPLCLPFSFSHFSPDKSVPNQPNLMGAPKALELQRVVYLDDIQKRVEESLSLLRKNCNYKSHMNQAFESDILKYYENDSASSLISIGLDGTVGLDVAIAEEHHTNAPYTNILNIYANKSYILNNNDVVKSYCALTQPIWKILENLISLRFQILEHKRSLNREIPEELPTNATTQDSDCASVQS
ncbi:hypothetical protein AB4619_22700 [Vibrio splendidus]